MSAKICENEIVSENADIEASESPNWVQKLLTAFPAFCYKNYRLYFLGLLASFIGVWIKIVAQGWLVLELTNSAWYVGLITGIGTLPILFFSLFGGVIVDRFNKKTIIMTTQTFLMFTSFIMGIITIFGLATVPTVAIFAFVVGTISAIDNPARHAFIVEMVDKKDLGSAIALNSGTYNAARVIGPTLAGILILFFGLGSAFLFTSFFYIPALIALSMVKTKPQIHRVRVHAIKAIKEGLFYVYGNKLILNLLVFVGITSIFGWSYITIMPVVVKDVFRQSADLLGYFYAVTGLGAVLGAIFVSMYYQKISPMKLIISGNVLFVISLSLFSFTLNKFMAMVLLFFSGLGLLTQFSMMNNVIQMQIDNNIRGRVMSIYTFMFMGLSPFGSFQIGFLAEKYGCQNAIRIGALIVFIFVFLLILNKKKVQIKRRLSFFN